MTPTISTPIALVNDALFTAVKSPMGSSTGGCIPISLMTCCFSESWSSILLLTISLPPRQTSNILEFWLVEPSQGPLKPSNQADTGALGKPS